MNEIKKIKTKIEDRKTEKEKKLLNSAYKLFITKGVNNTSIQDIVEDAGVAKGTFYLYFKDKYKIEEQLIIKKSHELFEEALTELSKKQIKKFEDQLIFFIDYVINELTKNPILIKFISKNLSLGFYSDKIISLMDNNTIKIHEVFMDGINKNNIKLKNPDVTLFMIIELVSSTCFTSIIKKQPLPIEEYKPYLYNTIKNMLKEK